MNRQIVDLKKHEKSELGERATSVGTFVSIIFAVLIGFTIYMAFMSTAEPTVDVRVVSLNILTSGESNLVAATLRNTGVATLENVVLSVTDDRGVDVILNMGNLAPGEARGAENWEGKWTAGKTYIVKISFYVPRKGEAIRVFTETAQS